MLGFWLLLEAWDTFGQDLIEIILLNLQDVLPELSGDDVRAQEQEPLKPDAGPGRLRPVEILLEKNLK